MAGAGGAADRLAAWIVSGLVVLMTLASAAVVIRPRAALGTHYATIEMLHLIGATDRQICACSAADRATTRMDYRTAVAAALLLLIGWQWSGSPPGLAATASLGPSGWALLALPLLLSRSQP